MWIYYFIRIVVIITIEITTDNDEIFEFVDINAKSSDDSIIFVSLTEKETIELESQDKTSIATITISMAKWKYLVT